MGLGTAIYVVAVLVGDGIGTLVGAKLPERMRERAIGIVTLLIVVSNFLQLATASSHTPTLTLVAVKKWECYEADRKGS
jgi:uncharacterized membrane protein YqgA involved in biofilm formation